MQKIRTAPPGSKAIPRPATPVIMADGSIADILAIRPEQIDLAVMASTLSKLVRWAGRHDGPGISIAQHSVMGADALYRETGDAICAGYFLLHDGHEYLVGDVIRSTVEALESLVADLLREEGLGGQAGSLVRRAIARLKDRLDLAVWQAAELAPIHRMPLYQRLVAEMDERMGFAEAKVLYRVRSGIPLVQCDLPAPRLTSALVPWGAMKAELLFVERLQRYLGIVLSPREALS